MSIFPYGTTLTRGTRIDDRFTTIKLLGRGGMGSVYLCQYDLWKTNVAVKFLETQQDVSAERFRREVKMMIKATANVGKTRSHIVRYLDHGTWGGKDYLIMDFIAGGSVANLLERETKLSARDAVWLIIQVVRGLRQAGVVHRDLKPENLLLEGTKVDAEDIGRKEWKGGVIKVADFGLSKDSDDVMSLTKSGQIMGTPYYMSPEQCRSTKGCDVRTDIYALGCILYQLVVGRVPFESDSPYEVLVKQCQDRVSYPSRGVDDQLKGILERCLMKEKSERYSSLKVLESELNKYLGVKEEGGGWLGWLGL